MTRIKKAKPRKAVPIIDPKCFILAPPINIIVKQTVNNIAAVEKSAGRIKPQIRATGHKIGIKPFLKSLMSSFLLVSIRET